MIQYQYYNYSKISIRLHTKAMNHITNVYDQVTKSIQKYNHDNSITETNMTTKTQSHLSLDDIQVQTNSCYQINDSIHVGQRRAEAKQE